jgi:hypothetical protein
VCVCVCVKGVCVCECVCVCACVSVFAASTVLHSICLCVEVHAMCAGVLQPRLPARHPSEPVCFGKLDAAEHCLLVFAAPPYQQTYMRVRDECRRSRQHTLVAHCVCPS